MPYKDPEKRRAANREGQKKYYRQNKAYYLKKAAERKKRQRQWLRELKTKSGCVNCGENDPVCLVYHHLNASDKKLEVANLADYSRTRILAEIAACVVLCLNCHRKEHGNCHE